MPRKHSVKFYHENGIYHVYNRGVEKRDIFMDRDDYVFFLHLLKTALSDVPKRGSTPSVSKIGIYKRKNFYRKIDLLAFCLMPNHFHLLVRQTERNSLTEFMRSLCCSYGMYFNKKYKRVGSLFQGIFKAIDIEEDNYLLWVSRYIHRNPDNFQTYPYSSYGDYLQKRHTDWINTTIILDYFSRSTLRQANNYDLFVDNTSEEPIDLSSISLEDEEAH